MIALDREHADLRRLIFLRLEGEASAAQCAELEQRLTDDAAAREIYVAYVQMAADLHWDRAFGRHASQPLAAPSDAPRPAAKERQDGWRRAVRQRLSHPLALSLLVASLFVTAGLLALALWTLPVWQPQPTLERGRIVAEVIRSRDAQWAPASLVDGQPPIDLLIGQPMELLQGTVALRFDRGAVTLLEGPATFVPQGRNRLLLRRGTLAARVPPRAIGFVVSTPAVDVVDLGTEFSVQAGETETEVHVLQGSVEVQRIHEDANIVAQVLLAGEAALFGDSSSQGFYVQEKEMNRSIFFGMMAMLATAGAAPAEAALIASDDFSSTNLTGGTGWTGGWTNPGGFLSRSATDSSPLPVGGGHYLSINAASAAAAGGAVSVWRNYTPPGGPLPVQISWDFRLDTELGGNVISFHDRNSGTGLSDGSSTFGIRVAPITIDNETKYGFVLYDGNRDNAGFSASQLVNSTMEVEVGATYSISVTLDPTTRSWGVSIFEVGDPSNSYSHDNLGFRRSQFTVPAWLGFGVDRDGGRTGSGAKGALSYSIDNVQINHIPEPSAWLLGAAGALFGLIPLVRRRRRLSA